MISSGFCLLKFHNKERTFHSLANTCYHNISLVQLHWGKCDEKENVQLTVEHKACIEKALPWQITFVACWSKHTKLCKFLYVIHLRETACESSDFRLKSLCDDRRIWRGTVSNSMSKKVRYVVEATTFWLLRYTTITKPTFRIEYVNEYCQLINQPGKNFCDEILTCNDTCIYLTQNRVSTTY